jgi:predicted dehydrogenase
MFSRRTFLATTAALAAPAVFSRTAGAAVNDSIRLGFIGMGKMASGHLGRFLDRPGVEVVAVCDVVKERRDDALERVAKKYAESTKSGSSNPCTAYSDFRELLDRKDIDAVVIATPDHWHAIPCVLAARAGKHIYCEKPLTHTVAEGRWIADEVAKAKVAFQTGSQQRSEYANRFRTAVEMIWNGWIGEVKKVRVGVGGPAIACDLLTEDVPPGTDWDAWLGPAPERGYNEILCPKGVHKHFPQWRKYREYAGGSLADFGAHHFDIAQWAIKMDRSGPVEIIPPKDEKADKGMRFIYANGVEMIHNEFENGIEASCVFEGPDGKVLVGRNQLEFRPKDGSKFPWPEIAKRVYPSSSHHENWLDGIRTGKECICPAEIGHRTASICHLASIGYELKRKLRWNPEAEQFVDDREADKLLKLEARAKYTVT